MKRLLLLLPLLLAACADDSFAVVSVLSYSGAMDGVGQFRVYVTNGSNVDDLLYPQQPSRPLHFDTNQPVTFSVEFNASQSGDATFEVEAMSAENTVMGYGKAAGAISEGSVAYVTVRVVPGAVRPEHALDGGTSSDGQGQLLCDPTAPAAACGTGQTCGLLCTPDQPALAMCYLGGGGNPGDACTSNHDCSSGSQCFTFSATGCSVMTCLRFCSDDLACGESDAYCNVPIQCGSSEQRLACSRPCDPAAGTGCAAGLSCFLYAGDTTDCACPGLGTVGDTCTQNSGCNGQADCAGCGAGESCVIPANADGGLATGVCRPVCKLGSSSQPCPSGTSCRAFGGSSRQLYGFCE